MTKNEKKTKVRNSDQQTTYNCIQRTNMNKIQFIFLSLNSKFYMKKLGGKNILVHEKDIIVQNMFQPKVRKKIIFG